jgi:hypothetical protein
MSFCASRGQLISEALAAQIRLIVWYKSYNHLAEHEIAIQVA